MKLRQIAVSIAAVSMAGASIAAGTDASTSSSPKRQELFHAGGNVGQRARLGGDVEPESLDDVQRTEFLRVVEQCSRVVRQS